MVQVAAWYTTSIKFFCQNWQISFWIIALMFLNRCWNFLIICTLRFFSTWFSIRNVVRQYIWSVIFVQCVCWSSNKEWTFYCFYIASLWRLVSFLLKVENSFSCLFLFVIVLNVLDTFGYVSEAHYVGMHLSCWWLWSIRFS